MKRRLDAVLREFYGWCEEQDVPLTAHANRSNYADDSFAEFGGPSGWSRVLDEFPRLRVNLGHFGGAAEKLPADSWPVRMVDLAVGHQHVYVDTGNHKVHDDALAKAYLAALARLLAEPGRHEMKRRIMFGSDWFMLAGHPEHQLFLSAYRALFDRRFDEPVTTDFLGGNALRFLGFKEGGSRNADRLRAFYARYAPDAVPGWLRSE